MMQIDAVELIGQRAKLIPMDKSHIEALFEAGRDARIWDFMSMRVESVSDMESLVAKALSGRETGVEFPFTIVDQDSGEVVGSTRFLDISAADRHLEIGWTWISPRVWRTRINTECKYLLLKHCFETLGTIRVQLKTDARNERSQKAIQRIGGVKEGILRNHRVMYDGYIRDSVYYSVVDYEWQGVKSRLESMLNTKSDQ